MEKEDKVVDTTTEKDVSTGSDLNIAEMSTEEITQAVEGGTLSVDDVKSYSEELEAQDKTSHESDKSQQILTDRLGKIEKLRNKTQTKEAPTQEQPKHEIDVEDLITLRENKFAKDSDEAKVLKQFKDAGIIVDYTSGLEDVAVKAKLEAISAAKIAAHQVDMNDDDILKSSRKEMLNTLETTGEVPEDSASQRKLAEDSLDKMGI